MKRKLTISTVAAAAILLCGPVFSQTASPPAAVGTGDAGALIKTDASTQKSSQMLASDIIGLSVRNEAGEQAPEVGKITDLVLDRDKQTVNVLVGVGGFLGIGAKDVGVPLDEVQFSPDSRFAVISLTKEQLEKAPAYTTMAMKKAQEGQASQRQQMNQPAQPPVPPVPAGSAKAQ